MKIFDKLFSMVGTCLAWFGAVTEPFRHWFFNNGFVMFFGSVGLLILGILLVTATKKMRESAWSGVEEMFEHATGYYSILVKLFYYPLVFETVMFCMISGEGQNSGMFAGIVDMDVKFTWYNYSDWFDGPKYFGAVIVLYFLMKTIACILRKRPFRLLKFYVHTADFAILGAVVGFLYVCMCDIRTGSFILSVLTLPLEWCLFLVYPVTMGLFLAPLVLLVAPIVMPLFWMLKFFVGMSPLYTEYEIRNEADAVAYGGYIKNCLDLFSE